MSKKLVNRRNFIRRSSCAAIGYTTLFSTLLNLRSLNAATMANTGAHMGGGYKALVCILLEGGNDSFNMLIPRGNPEYQEYAVSRSNLAIPQNQILAIDPLTSDGKDYGLHPAMPQIQNLFNSGRAAFIANVGSLVEPTTLNQYYNNSVNLPLGLQSHADQIKHWQTAFPQVRTPTGWGGKIADLIGDMNSNQNISMNISLNGKNTFQTGLNTIEYAIDPYNGAIGIYGYEAPDFYNSIRRTAIDNMLDHNYQDMFLNSYKEVVRSAQDAHVQFSAAIDSLTPFNTNFTGDDWQLSESMEMIAKTIAARNILGFSRQTFFISFGGWDHHDEVLNAQSDMLGVLDNALHEFNSVLDELNLADCVTVFTISDFARTLTSNGNGTDHAWGGNALVMGGALNGKNIYGTYPSLDLGNNLDTGGGVLIPTMSADEYFAELALWFGVSPSDLSTILPNISNFYNVNSGMAPVGFLQMP